MNSKTMSYLSFLRIQYSMGNDDSKIINYVLFGKREELTQFPETGPVKLLTGAAEWTEFRPVYLFWDKTDEMLMRFYERWQNRRQMRYRYLSFVVKRHMQNKYKEVFLSNPETLFLSERAEKEIPRDFWEAEPPFKESLFSGFGKAMAIRMLGKTTHAVTVFLALESECRYAEVLEWLVQAESAAGTKMTNLFLLGAPQQKEYGEELLEQFYEETGLAGSFYPDEECRKLLAVSEGESLLLDCRGISFGQLGRPAYYIDGAGVRTGKEMRRLGSVCKACYSLRNHLDRAFLSAL